MTKCTSTSNQKRQVSQTGTLTIQMGMDGIVKLLIYKEIYILCRCKISKKFRADRLWMT